MTTDDEKRAEVARNWEILIAHGSKIGYLYGGGLPELGDSPATMTRLLTEGHEWEPDCRAAVNWACKWAGFKAFPRFGWGASSAEMWEVLPRFSDIREAGIGTIVVYGEGGDAHVAQVITNAGSSNPWLGSHGYAFSPNRVSYLAETQYHAALGQPVTLLAVGELL